MGLFDWLEEERKKRLPQIGSYVDAVKNTANWASNSYNPLDRDFWQKQNSIQNTIGKSSAGNIANYLKDTFTNPYLGFGDEQTREAHKNLGQGFQRFATQSLPTLGLQMTKDPVENADLYARIARYTNPTFNQLGYMADTARKFIPDNIEESVKGRLREGQGATVDLLNRGQAAVDNWGPNKTPIVEENATPSQKGAALLGQGLPSVAGSVALTAATRSPVPAVTLFGALQKSQTYKEARDAGMDRKQASLLSTGAGLTEAGLERVGLGLFFKKFGTGSGLTNYALNAGVKTFTEAMQEGSQQLGSNTWAKLGYDAQRNLMDGVVDSMVVGGLFGGAAGGSAPSIDVQLFQKARESGMNPNDAKKFSDVVGKVIKGQQAAQNIGPEPSEQGQFVENKSVGGNKDESQENLPAPTEETIPATPPVVTPQIPQVTPVQDTSVVNENKPMKADEITPEEFNLIEANKFAPKDVNFDTWTAVNPRGQQLLQALEQKFGSVDLAKKFIATYFNKPELIYNALGKQEIKPTPSVNNLEDSYAKPEEPTVGAKGGKVDVDLLHKEHDAIKLELSNLMKTAKRDAKGNYIPSEQKKMYALTDQMGVKLDEIKKATGLDTQSGVISDRSMVSKTNTPQKKNTYKSIVPNKENIVNNNLVSQPTVGAKTYYHVTNEEGAKNIIENGVIPGKNRKGLDVFNDLESAREYQKAMLSGSPEMANKSSKIIEIQGDALPHSKSAIKSTDIVTNEGFKGARDLSQPTVGDNTADQPLSPEGALKLKQDVGKITLGTKTKERGHITTMKESAIVPDDLKELLESEYTPDTNKALIDNAKARIFRDKDAAMDFALNTAKGKITTPQYTDEAVATGYLLMQDAYKRGDLKTAGYISIKMAENLTAAAKVLQASKILNKWTPEGLMTYIDRTIDKSGAKPITEDQREYFYKMAKEISALPDGMDKDIARYVLMEEASDLIPSKSSDKFANVWRAGLLTGTATHLLNLVSTGANLTAEQSARLAAVPIDWIFSAITGKRAISGSLKGYVSGAKDGLGKAAILLKTGYDPNRVLKKNDYKHVTYNTKAGKVAGKGADFVYRLLGAEDSIMWNMAYQNALHQQVKLNPGSSFEKPTGKMVQAATEIADRATFKNDTMLGKTAQQLQKIPYIGPFVVPFTTTPAAIAMQVIRYTPGTAVFTVASEATKALTGKGGSRAAVEMAIGRNTIGAIPFLIGALLVGGDDEDKITGAYPTDKATQAQWEAEGKIPYAIKLPDGKWHQLQAFGPPGLIMAVGATYGRSMKAGDTQSGAITNAVLSIIPIISSQSFLQGVSDLFETFSNVSKSESDTIAGSGSRYLINRASSLIPMGIGEIAETIDPYKRESNGLAEALMAKIPGLRQKLEIKRDVFGNPIERRTGRLGFVLDPSRPSNARYAQDMVMIELARLKRQDLGAMPLREYVDQKVGDQKYKLSSEQLTRFEQQLGQNYYKYMSELMNSPQYAALNDEQKQNVLQDVREIIKKPELIRFLHQEGLMDKNTTQDQVDKLENQQVAYLQRGTVQVAPREEKGKTYSGSTASGMGGIRFKGQGEYDVRDAKYQYDKLNYKNTKNLKGYMEVSQAQYNAYEQQIASLDPQADLADIYDLRRKQLTIAEDMKDILSSGGFSGGGGGKKTIKFAKPQDFGMGEGLSTISTPSLPAISIKSKTGGASGPGRVATAKRRIGTL